MPTLLNRPALYIDRPSHQCRGLFAGQEAEVARGGAEGNPGRRAGLVHQATGYSSFYNTQLYYLFAIKEI